MYVLEIEKRENTKLAEDEGKSVWDEQLRVQTEYSSPGKSRERKEEEKKMQKRNGSKEYLCTMSTGLFFFFFFPRRLEWQE